MRLFIIVHSGLAASVLCGRQQGPVIMKGNLPDRCSSSYLNYLFSCCLICPCKKGLFSLNNFIHFWLCCFCCCADFFSSCGEQGLLSSYGERASHCSDFSCGAEALGSAGFSSSDASEVAVQ